MNLSAPKNGGMEAMAELEIEQIPVLSDNYAYLLHEPERRRHRAWSTRRSPRRCWSGSPRNGWKLDWILSTHHHADHTGGNLELKQATGCRVAGARGGRGEDPGHRRQASSRATSFELGEADGAGLRDARPHLGPHQLLVSRRPARCSAPTRCSRSAAAGCSRARTRRCGTRSRKLAALPDDALVYCGHEYTQPNARFALSVDPDNPALQARAAEVERQRAAGKPTVPTRLAPSAPRTRSCARGPRDPRPASAWRAPATPRCSPRSAAARTASEAAAGRALTVWRKLATAQREEGGMTSRIH